MCNEIEGSDHNGKKAGADQASESGHRHDGWSAMTQMVIAVAIAATLTIAAYRNVAHAHAADAAALAHTLQTMRDAIGRFHADHHHYPPTLDALVEHAYLPDIPPDPVTRNAYDWQVVPPPVDAWNPAATKAAFGVFDVRSGASGATRDGTPYDEL